MVYEGWVMTLDVTKVISVSLELEGRQTVKLTVLPTPTLFQENKASDVCICVLEQCN